MSSISNRKGGFITSIILIIIAFILLKYFFNLEPKAAIDLGWSYIKAPVMFAWDRVIWPLLSLAWNNFQELIHSGKIPGTPNLPSA